jgi:hypothetical protein
MAELSTLARPYAEAVFRLAKEKNALGEWSGRLATLAAIAGNEQMLAVIADPNTSSARAAELIGSIASADEAGKNLLGVLAGNDRLTLLPEISAQYEVLKAEAEGVLERVDMVVGTFSKGLAGVGGFATGPHPQWAALRLASRPYIFTASPSPATVAATRQALAIITSERGAALRKRLDDNARRLHAGLMGMGWRLGADPGPVVAVILEDAGHTLHLWHALLEQGYYVNMMIPPAAPRGLALLRLSLSAAHDETQIDGLLAACAALSQS